MILQISSNRHEIETIRQAGAITLHAVPVLASTALANDGVYALAPRAVNARPSSTAQQQLEQNDS